MSEEILVYLDSEDRPGRLGKPLRFPFASGGSYQIPHPVHELDTIELIVRGPLRDARYLLRIGSTDFEPTVVTSGLMWDSHRFLANYRGWVALQVVRERAGERAITEIMVACLPSKITEDQYRAMLADVERVSRSLLCDVAGGRPEVARRGRAATSELSGMPEYEAIGAMVERMRSDIHRLAAGPGVHVKVERERKYSWGLEGLDERAKMELISAGIDPRNPTNLPFLCSVPTRTATTELHENAQIANFLRSLHSRLGLVIDSVQIQIDRINEDRWWRDNTPSGRKSIWESEDVPRLRQLDDVVGTCRSLRRAIPQDVQTLPGAPTTPSAMDLRPTSLFLRDPVYSRLYRQMLSFLRTHGAAFDHADFESQAYAHGTDRLYEYWIYLNMVHYLRERVALPAGEFGQLYERSSKTGAYTLSIERSVVNFQLDEERTIRLYYSPLIFPRDVALRSGHPYYRLGEGRPLSPDFLIEVRRGETLEMGVVLDAKYMTEVSRELNDLHHKYLPAIFDTRTDEAFSRVLWILYVGETTDADRPAFHVETHSQRPVFLRNDAVRLELGGPDVVVLGAMRYAPSPWGTPDSSLDQLEPLLGPLLAELGIETATPG